MSAQATPERPGGWVDGIGWVARLCDLDGYDEAHETEEDDRESDLAQMWTAHHRRREVVVVTRWADGTVPAPPSASQVAVDWRQVAADLYEAIGQLDDATPGGLGWGIAKHKIDKVQPAIDNYEYAEDGDPRYRPSTSQGGA
jgi:hypothetical protein